MHMVKVLTPVSYPAFAQGTHNSFFFIFVSFSNGDLKSVINPWIKTNQQEGESNHYILLFETQNKYDHAEHVFYKY